MPGKRSPWLSQRQFMLCRRIQVFLSDLLCTLAVAEHFCVVIELELRVVFMDLDEYLTFHLEGPAIGDPDPHVRLVHRPGI